jgi:guanosine-3',5'-bis(diphosphate) 3'-pyrophosphohydrolase
MTGETGLLLRALAFAAERHSRQRRKDVDASPYINHPIALANVIANEAGIDSVELLAAAILHDTLEDTETAVADLDGAFGPRICSIVVEVTDDKLLAKAVRKQLQIDLAPQLSREAKIVKLADKICNLRDVAAAPPVGWSLERRQEYFDWAKQVVDRLRGAHPGLEAIFDAAYARRPR